MDQFCKTRYVFLKGHFIRIPDRLQIICKHTVTSLITKQTVFHKRKCVLELGH